jgi:hypothetical protein
METEQHFAKQPVTEEIRQEIKVLEIKRNENTTYQNLWDIAQAEQRVMLIAMSV